MHESITIALAESAAAARMTMEATLENIFALGGIGLSTVDDECDGEQRNSKSSLYTPSRLLLKIRRQTSGGGREDARASRCTSKEIVQSGGSDPNIHWDEVGTGRERYCDVVRRWRSRPSRMPHALEYIDKRKCEVWCWSVVSENLQ